MKISSKIQEKIPQDKTNMKYWKSNYFILRDTNLNSFALNIRNFYFKGRNSKQSKPNII